MKISTRTRYGTKLMLALALNYGKGLQYLKEVARKEDISEKYLSQIIIPLKAAGLVNSVRGVHGGYSLAKEPKEITMWEIFQALEGGISAEADKEQASKQSPVTSCINQNIWRKLQKAMEQNLESINLQDLIDSYKQQDKGEIIYNI